MAYNSCCVSEAFRQITEEFSSLRQIRQIFNRILRLQKSIKDFDNFFNDLNLIILIINSYICVVCICFIYFEPIGTIKTSLSILVEAFLHVLAICLVSNRIQNRYRLLLNKFEDLELKNMNMAISFVHNEPVLNYSLINRLYAMKDELSFTAYNSYQINFKTLISILNLILGFSVIFVQTF